MTDPTLIDWLKSQPVPILPDQTAAIAAITLGPPSILMFKHWHWLTGKPVPTRRNLQSDSSYVGRHWWRLKKAAVEWSAKAPPNHLDNPGNR